MLELVNVSKQVGMERHIDDVSLTLEAGTLNVLLGPTLSGKTTLMRLMAGLDKPTAGDVRFDGSSVLGVPVRSRSVAMVYQQFINYPGLSVYENIASPMRIAGASADVIDKRVRQAAELMKLGDFLDRTPLNLSGGQQQRTALARALVRDARLVLLDEPLANLDYKLREELRVELPRLFAETGAIFVYATTEPHEALLLGGKTATLSQGRITQFGDTLGVYQKPADLLTAQTFADPPLNTAPAQQQSGELILGAERFSVPDGPPGDGSYTLALRPHHLGLQAAGDRSVRVQATVGTSEITGSETFIHVEADGNRWVVLTHGVHRVEKGQHIDVFFDPQSVYLFDDQGKLARAPAARGGVPVSSQTVNSQAAPTDFQG